MAEDEVEFNLSKETLLSILKRAASQDRTVVEFRTEVIDGERSLHRALDITDHVESLERDQDVSND